MDQRIDLGWSVGKDKWPLIVIASDILGTAPTVKMRIQTHLPPISCTASLQLQNRIYRPSLALIQLNLTHVVIVWLKPHVMVI